MKIYLTKTDVLEILARHFGLDATYSEETDGRKRNYRLMKDELYWEGNKEQTKKES